jgi:hypothetical protein
MLLLGSGPFGLNFALFTGSLAVPVQTESLVRI